MKKILTDWFTESDNKTWDPVKFLAFVAVLAGIAFVGIAMAIGKPFDIQAYGLGVGAMFAGLAPLLWGKKETANVGA